MSVTLKSRDGVLIQGDPDSVTLYFEQDPVLKTTPTGVEFIVKTSRWQQFKYAALYAWFRLRFFVWLLALSGVFYLIVGVLNA